MFLSLVGKTGWHDVTRETFLEALRGRSISNSRVNALREEILGAVLGCPDSADVPTATAG